jgi:crotonobetainyl-CoA:carnitine CoA-transferase CaiB-like acyl-CoA transferase
MGIPVKLRLSPGEIKGRSPKLGEHTEEILTNLLGHSPDEIASFEEREIL